MIFDFYENFSSLYPLRKEELLRPDREKFGYYWDFEDFLVENEKGKGLVLQGFMISTEEDLSGFIERFDRAFLRFSIGSIIKNAFFDLALWDEDLKKKVERKAVDEIKSDFSGRIDRRDDFLLSLKSSLKEGNIWIATNSYWSILVKKDIESFWGNGVKIKTLPDDFSIMNRKDVWEEVDLLGPLNFEPEMAWQDLSFSYPNLVKYIDEGIRQKSGVDFLDQCHDFGLI
jgi:hypothetical protein